MLDALLQQVVGVALLRLARVDLRRTPSSPACSSAAAVRYGLQEESTPRYSKRPPDATRTVVVRFCQPQFL